MRIMFLLSRARRLLFLTVAAVVGVGLQAPAQDTGTAASHASTRSVGTVQSISGKTLSLKLDSGSLVSVTVPDGARVLRVAAGQTDIKSATPIALSDIHVSDRMLVSGVAADDGKALSARTIVIMAKADVAAVHQQEQQVWREGIAGVVTAFDPAAGTITVKPALGEPVLVHATEKTIERRYAPGSPRFQDAQPSKLDQIKVGDQLRARGTATAERKDFAADEIVSGTFQNVAGRITSVDASTGTVSVSDLLSKHPVTLSVTAGTDLRQLPEQMATRIAARVKNVAPGAQPSNTQPERPATGTGSQHNGGMGSGGSRAGRAPDFQQVLGFAPKTALGDLKKGDAIMAVAMPGANSGAPVAVTLVSGVEPILTASPAGSSAAALLSSWNMSAAPAADTQAP
jgi:hypothetical protein